jgi:hypothetical protein
MHVWKHGELEPLVLPVTERRGSGSLWTGIAQVTGAKCGPHRAGQVARYKVGAENRLRSSDIISGGQCFPRVGTCAPDAIH